jgi:hypothetical protein
VHPLRQRLKAYSAECVEGLFLFASVNKAVLIYLPELRNCIGPKPQRYVGRCHGFLNHTDQAVVQYLQIRLVPQRGEKASRVFLASYFLR